MKDVPTFEANWIEVRCFTNLDEYKREEWPTKLPGVPVVGHWMSARSGKLLAIVNITWQFDGTLRVELHQIR